MSVTTLESTRFYNGQSSSFQQNFIYTKPDTDFRDDNGNAYWNVNAPPKAFFTVPFELGTSEGGVWRIGIHKEITDRFGLRGIVRIDANSRQAVIADLQKQKKEASDNFDSHLETAKLNGFVPPAKESDLLPELAEFLIVTATDNRFAYVAFDDASAKTKGDKLWRLHLRQIIDDFEHENNRRVTERGTTPLRPNNFVAHAYKELGMDVPGDEKFIKAGVQQTDVGNLKTAVAQQAETINTQSEQIRVLLERLNQLAPPASSDAEQQQEAVGAAAGNGVGNGKEKTHKNK